ncbi:MAG: alanine--tRNA ligase [Acidobacteriota bacterium]
MSPSAEEVRQAFLDYFSARGHTVVPSSSLVPLDDPTLLFINAGMNQFKGTFLGQEERPYRRAASAQKCMRVSGKHNDLENVGPSTYHHTFFEMLGNFSFGDYFKAEAIEMAWELLVDGYGLPQSKLWASVYEQDDEAHELWKTVVGISDSRLVRLGRHENFWAMGETGPCGPCSEVHYDYGKEHGCCRPDCGPGCGCGRFIELWNLVFMQYNCNADGELTPLPSPNIDTGAGLERLTAVLQGVDSNYDTDLFRPLISQVADSSGHSYGESDDFDVALRVIADHSRAVAFLLADGVSPANEGRGYVLRRLIRRAVRFGRKLGFDHAFMYRTAGEVVARMGGAYPTLRQAEELILRLTEAEEERFFQTLGAGARTFDQLAAEIKSAGESKIPGEVAFRLYDTYGLPLELSREFAGELGMEIDEEGFQKAMEGQRRRARSAWKGSSVGVSAELVKALRSESGNKATVFLGYDQLDVDDARVLALCRDGEVVPSLRQGEQGGMVVDRTPFYGEAGGQVGDQGEAVAGKTRAVVVDTRRLPGGLLYHQVKVDGGSLEQGQTVALRVDAERRHRTMRNHTATHLLQAALRARLGEHVRQAGSLVAPDRLRFDFNHYKPLSPEELMEVERQVNEAIRHDYPTEIAEMAHAEALERGALAFFGDKYGERVRVVAVPGISLELCGGTHVCRTGQIGAVLITREESVAAGTRRIEAVTGADAIEFSQRHRHLLHRVMVGLQSNAEELPAHVESLVERLRSSEREVARLRVKLASERAGELIEAEGTEIDGVRVVSRRIEGLDAAGLRNLADQLKVKLGSGVVVLGACRESKAQLVVGVTTDLSERLSAATVVRSLAVVVGGGGGGHRQMAEAGGPDGDRLGEALDRVPEVVAELLRSSAG